MQRALVCLAGLVALAATATVHAQPFRGGFDVPPDYFGGMVAGDFDGDRDADLLFVDGVTSRAHVFTQGADRRFTEVHDFQAGIPFTERTADLDADGYDDVAISSLAVQAILVAYGDPDARFSDARTITAPMEVRDFSIADLNGDGLLDIAIGGGERGQVTTAQSTVPRTLRTGAVLPSPVKFPHVIVAADMNGDGKKDIAVVGRNPDPPHLCVFEGKGDGAFGDPLLLESPIPNVGQRFLTAAQGDFDQDGRDEFLLILEVRTRPDGPPGTLFEVSKEGAAYVARELDLPVAWDDFPAIEAADMDRDGWLDAVMLSSRTVKAVGVFLNKGVVPTAFLDPCRISAQAAVESIAVRDLGAGAAPDIVLSHAQRGAVELVYSPLEQCGRDSGCFGGESDACFESGGRFEAHGPQRIAALSILGRDAMDLAVAGEGEARILSLEAGAFRQRAVFSAPAVVGALAAADIDGDGDLDIAATDFASSTVQWVLLDPSGLPEGPARSQDAGLLPVGLVLADLDLDGKVDIAVSLSGEGKVALLAGLGRGEFRAARKIDASSSPQALAAGDIDGDGFIDLVAANRGASYVSILKGSADGAFAPPWHATVVKDPRELVVRDLNADLSADIVTASRDVTGVTVLFSRPPAFRPRILSLPAGSLTTGLVMTDLNGDGMDDGIVANSGTKTVVVFDAKEGDDFLREGRVLVLCSPEGAGQPISVAAGDLDGDGHVDIAAGDGGAGEVLLYRSLGCRGLPSFRRGDVDGSGSVEITDAVALLLRLFAGGSELPCNDAADADDGGSLDLTDAVFLLAHLFRGGPAPPDPGPGQCGRDPTADTLECGSAAACG